MNPADQLPFVAVRIDCEDADGASSVGTGFFFVFPAEDGQVIPLLITNKHVIEGAIMGTIRMHRADSDGQPAPAEWREVKFTRGFEGLWLPHPDPQVDLAALPIGQLLEMLPDFKPYYVALGSADIMRADDPHGPLTAVEDILMIGYPIGLWDSRNNRPIIRRGVTATDPKLDYQGRREFVIDAACFPGSSGSPIVLWNLGSWSSGGGLVLGNRVKLLGVLYAGPQYTAEGQIVVRTVPTASVPLARTAIPTNLGYVIKADRILEFERVLASSGPSSAPPRPS